MHITETVCVVFASIRYVNVRNCCMFFLIPATCSGKRLCYHWHIESLDSEAPAQRDRHHTDDSDSLNMQERRSPSLRSVRTSIRVPVRIPIGQPQPQAVTPGSGLSD